MIRNENLTGETTLIQLSCSNKSRPPPSTAPWVQARSS